MEAINKYGSLFLVACLSFGFCFGQQQDKDAQFHFHSINEVGLLNGETGSSWQFQTINGVAHKSWFAGIGVGMDYYRIRSIPVFADVRKTFGTSKNKPFVYANGGISFTWATDKQKYYDIPGDHFGNGLYLDGGAGYQFHISGKNALLVSLGYSYKNAKEYAPVIFYSFQDYVPVTLSGGPSSYIEKFDYHLRRLSFKLSWSF